MGCEGYGLLLSRYVDDDLEGPEAEKLMRHLSVCPSCQSELGALERLRTWIRAADLPPDVLELFDSTTLADRVDSWEPLNPSPRKVPRARSWVEGVLSLWQRPLEAMGRFASAPAGLRFALPLLALGIVAGFLLARSPESGKTVDVRQLPSAVAMKASLMEGDRDREDLYVLEHASQQPWVRYGDELPVIQLVSEGSN